MLGFLNISKPSGVTSHDVVQRVRKAARMKHVGHGGTLDPLAQGVLPVALGAACRLLRYLPGDKVYRAEILLGKQTDTDDIEGKSIAQHEGPLPELDQIRQALAPFLGEIDQVPPQYSAVHHQGERLYALARQGRAVEAVPARKVRVHEIEFLSYAAPLLSLRIKCGAGTYIRSIARDLGASLKVGGCLNALVRERAGAFALDNALNLEELSQAAQDGKDLSALLLSPLDALRVCERAEFLELDDQVARRICLGQKLRIDDLPEALAARLQFSLVEDKLLLAVHREILVAICRVERNDEGNEILRPEIVIPNACQS